MTGKWNGTSRVYNRDNKFFFFFKGIVNFVREIRSASSPSKVILLVAIFQSTLRRLLSRLYPGVSMEDIQRLIIYRTY